MGQPRIDFTRLAIVGLTAVVVILLASVLGLSIAILVHVNQMQDDYRHHNNHSTPTPPADEAKQLNIPMAESIQQNGKNLDKFSAYSNFTARLRASMNLAESPCNNFFEYACGNRRQPISFAELTIANLAAINKQLRNIEYVEQAPKTVKQAKLLVEQCVKAESDWAAEVGGGARLRDKMHSLAQLMDTPFPSLTENDPKVDVYPSKAKFAQIIGTLNRDEQLSTFVTSNVDTNWKEPQSAEQPYLLFFDQATLLYPSTYYLNAKHWEGFKQSYLAELIAMVTVYSVFSGVKPDLPKIGADCAAIVDLEYKIATELNRSPNERRNYASQFNVYDVNKAYAEFDSLGLDFSILLTSSYRLPSRAKAGRINKFVINEPKALRETLRYLFSEVSSRTIYNYFYVRLLADNIRYLPELKPSALHHRHTVDFGHFGRPRKDEIGVGGKIVPELPAAIVAGFTPDQAMRMNCINRQQMLFPHAFSRVFLDTLYPEKAKRLELRQKLGTMIASVVDAFRGMVVALDWIDSKTKEEAQLKIDGLVLNLAWPNFIENDLALADYYADLKLSVGMSFTEMVDALQLFNQNLGFKKLFLAKEVDRRDFEMGSSIVNAWYNPAMNSITIPLGIVGRPFYDPNTLASVNYGALGIVVGHELTHGFDDEGVQWDGQGAMHTWMDADSREGFLRMAQCVVDEYGRFEPLPGQHIDGVMTQGENIADNGGLRAAFHAFITHQGLEGPDPRLPDARLKALTQEQLFFLSFAQDWCNANASPDPKKFLIDPHSPPKFRILGSLQNFPAFRAAFNCPLEAIYAPGEHCQVWESESRVPNSSGK